MQHLVRFVASTIAVALGVSSAAASPKLQNVQVTFTRTITDDHVETYTNSGCNASVTTHTSFVETIALGSEAFPIDIDGDLVTLDAPTDPMPAGARPIGGTATFDMTGKSHGSATCAKAGDVSSNAHGVVAADKVHVSFRTDAKRGTGEMSIDPGFPPSAGTAGASADLYAGTLGNVSLQTGPSWKAMGAARASLEKGLRLSAQDAPMTVSRSGDTIQMGFTLSHDIPIDEVLGVQAYVKSTGKRSVATTVRITIGGNPKKP